MCEDEHKYVRKRTVSGALKNHFIFYLCINKYIMMKFGKLIFAIFFVLTITWGCDNDEACLSNQNAVQARFLSAWSQTEKDSTLSDVSLTGLGREDSIYRNQQLNELFMPLNFESDTTSFVVSAQTLRDTLHLVHKSELDFISGECGHIFNFNIDTILHTNAFIDSVSIVYPEVKYGESTNNIQLFIY